MRRATALLTLAALAASATPARAHPVADSRNMELVADFHIAEAVHMEFLVRGGRTYALVGSRNEITAGNGGLSIVDVTDPTNPVRTGFVQCAQHNNDPAISPDGNTVVITADGGSSCSVPALHRPSGWLSRVRDFGIVDITDLSAPKLLGTPRNYMLEGVHTAVFHPRERIAYLSTQNTASRSPTLPILDLRGPAPVLTEWPAPQVGSSPHDITFNPDGTRAYVSAVTVTYILDTTDPLNPSLVSVVHHPGINIHHEAMLGPNGRYLVVVDEQAGAIVNPQCPGGGLHVFDLLDDRAPIFVGAFFAQDFRTLPEPPPGDTPRCTAHEGNFTSDGRLFSIGWYNAGARVFDTSVLTALDTPPGAPVGWLVSEVAFLRTQGPYAWAAKTHPNLPGYVFTSNTAGALEVSRLTLS